MSLPVSLSVLSSPGTDVQLVALLSELEDKGIVRPVDAGLGMYADVK